MSEGAGDSKREGFLGFVAHEVRNPLSTALWSAEILSRMPEAERAGARGERLTAMCLRSISRVRQLVEDHFLCERLDAGGIAVRLEPVPVREVLEEILARPGDRGEVVLEVDPATAAVADRALLERALDSLLATASAERSNVRVAERPGEGGGLALLFEGRAPPPDALRDPAKGSPGDARGRALALPLVRRIAEALGGALAVAGDAYVLSLPRDQAYVARPKPAANP